MIKSQRRRLNAPTVLAGILAVGLAAASSSVLAQGAPSALDVVKSRDVLRCGIHAGLAGFASPDRDGNWKGIDVDVCRAVASAVLGSAKKVLFIPLSAKDRFTALQSGEIDLLSRVTTWTLARNTQTALNFTGINYFDGQGFMVKSSSGLKSAKELNGATICVVQGTSTEKTLADYFLTQGMKFEPVAYSETDAVSAAYLSGRCDALTSDRSQLAAIRWTFNEPASHVILPEIITKEPLGPSVRFGDSQWANVVRWSLNAMIEAEELGLDSKNIRSQAEKSVDPAVQRFTGKSDNLGKMLGLDSEWAIRIVEQVGNYAESYERNIAPIGLDRGVNRLWRDGGLLISPPFR